MLDVILCSAKQRNDTPGHLLFNGPPGLGKTTLAVAIANELGCPILIANAGTITSPKNIKPYLLQVEEGSILFIDEIHRLNTRTAEFLYPVMEDFRMDIGGEDEGLTFDLPKFSLVGATTESGALPRPLYDRFTHKFQLELYSPQELSKLLTANARRLRINLSDSQAEDIARRSRGTPRVANNLLKWVRDYSIKHREINIGKAMELAEIDQDGLDKRDREYLSFLSKCNGPVGLHTIVNSTSLDLDTVESVIEPFLLSLGRIQKTSKGRVLC